MDFDEKYIINIRMQHATNAFSQSGVRVATFF